MRIRFNTYSLKSSGLKAIKEELVTRGHDAKIIKHNRSRYTPSPADLIINWGVRDYNLSLPALNTNARNATNKLIALTMMQARNKLRFTTDMEKAKQFKLCYCRLNLHSYGGGGIVLATSPAEVVPAPLYTKGITKVAGEYRVHVFKGQVIDFSKKMRMSNERLEVEGITHNPHIRNHANGYVFGRDGVDLPEKVALSALNAVEDLGLDFGAADVVLSGYSNNAFCLEVNTAPGMEGTTVQRYADAIEGYFSGR